MAKQSSKQIASNRKAFHDYFIEDKYEAGIELAGTEVKSIRLGAVNLRDSFCAVKDGEMFLYGMHISPYEKGNIFNKDPRRTRRLLLHRRDPQAPGPGAAGRLFPDPALAVLLRPPGEGGAGAGPRQKALRQAGGRRPAGRQARDGPGLTGPVLKRERDGNHEQSHRHH